MGGLTLMVVVSWFGDGTLTNVSPIWIGIGSAATVRLLIGTVPRLDESWFAFVACAANCFFLR